MARSAAQSKMGFYPIDEYVMGAIASHLSLTPGKQPHNFHIIDPCCGKGAALHQLATSLGLPMEQVYGVELDGNRAEESKALMPGAHIKGPASYFGMRITGVSYGLVYCNPPFDSEFGGGGREEQKFVEESTRLLVGGGVLVLVCPRSAINGNRGFCKYLDSRYENMRVFTFPVGISKTTGFEYRQYNEICIIATKRRQIVADDDNIQAIGTLHQMGMEWMTQISWEHVLTSITFPQYKTVVRGRVYEVGQKTVYQVPTSWQPLTFVKSQYLPEELAAVLARSPLQKLLRDVEPIPLARPPISPGKGHVAMLLAAGQLDGVVEGEDGGNHVVRGTAKKVEYYNETASTSEVNPENGCLTTKDVYSEKVCLIIRAVWQDGDILTLSDQPESATEPDPLEGEETARNIAVPWED